jgi:hypothetical protein
MFFDNPIGYDVFKKCYQGSSFIGSKFEDVFQGIATSKDALYIVKLIDETDELYKILVNPENKNDNPKIESKEFWVEKKFFRPFLMGKDVHRYDNLKTDRLVFIPYFVDEDARLVTSEVLKSGYSNTWKYVSFYADVFQARESGRANSLNEWYAYIYPKNLGKFTQSKLPSMEICSNHTNVTIDNSSTYHTTKVYSIVKKVEVDISDKFFVGLLNSKLMWWFLKHTGDTLQGDARTMKTNYINPFPLPKVISKSDDNLISELVTELISEKANTERDESIELLEQKINSAVYNLYDLNNEDINAIEQAI